MFTTYVIKTERNNPILKFYRQILLTKKKI